MVAGAPAALDLPTDRPRPAVQTFVGASVPIEVSAGLTEALQQLSRGTNSTLAIVLLAAWQALLSRYSGQVDIAVGSPIANRTHRELEQAQVHRENSWMRPPCTDSSSW